MKKSILLAAAFVAFIATSCRKIEMDGGTTVVTQPTTPGVQTIILKGRIDKDTVLREGNNYILSGIVYMGYHVTSIGILRNKSAQFSIFKGNFLHPRSHFQHRF